MSVTDDDITPDRLRMADWDGCYDVFTVAGREGDFWTFEAGGRWFWAGPSCDPAELTGMADVAARLAAAGGGGP